MLVLICIRSGSLLKSKSNQEVGIEFIKLLLKLGGIRQEAVRALNGFIFIGDLVKKNHKVNVFFFVYLFFLEAEHAELFLIDFSILFKGILED